MIPEGVARFREEYRPQIPGWYSGVGHFLFTTLCTLGAIVFCAVHVRSPRPLEWLTLPFAFLFANFAEYRAHRGPMHNRTRLLDIVYRRHAASHHLFYTHEAMAAETSRDFHMVLFPPSMLLFFIGLQMVPIGLLLGFAVSPNVAYLFCATALSYFLTYEWLHTAYHLPDDSLIRRLPFIATLRRLHQTHHDQRLMHDWNFNITFPIFDAVYRTRHKGD